MVKGGSFCFSLKFKNHRAQLTLFVIIALIIIAVIAGYFLIKSDIFPRQIPVNMQEFYNYYLSCIDTTTKEGAGLMGLHGGYLEKPDFKLEVIMLLFQISLLF